MTIEVPCSGCGRTLKVGQEHAGKMARCPVCGHITQVPAGGQDAGAAPAPAVPATEVPHTYWYMRTPEGQEFGPTMRSELDRWVGEGRVTADCQLREGEGGSWQNADAVYPALKPAMPVLTPMLARPLAAATSPYNAPSYYADRPGGGYSPLAPAGGAFAPAAPGYQVPHRGALILVLGLLGFFVCFILGIMAWVMGSNDLREMEAGRMDRSGMDLTRAGMIIGMIVSILSILGLLLWFGLIFLGALVGR